MGVVLVVVTKRVSGITLLLFEPARKLASSGGVTLVPQMTVTANDPDALMSTASTSFASPVFCCK